MRCKGEGMGVSGGQRGKSSLTGAMVRYGHIDANVGFNNFVVAVDKSQQSESNSSGSKTHKRPGTMCDGS